MEEKEIVKKFQMFERQIIQAQEQLQAVEQGLFELQNLDAGLGGLIGKVGEEILAPIGRGVFVKAKLLSEELSVDVGEKTFVKKTIPETQGIIQEQIGKLTEIKDQLEDQLEEINQELTKTMLENQEHACACGHDHECGCEEDSECNCEDDCECD
jgi:prefoldin alpha subunit